MIIDTTSPQTTNEKLTDLSRRTVGAVISVYSEGKLLRYFAQGKIYKDSENIISNDTLVHLGSNTKAFTSALIIIAHLDGVLNLHDPVSKWVDIEGFNRNETITLKHLLKHESGLRKDIPNHLWSNVYDSSFIAEDFLKKNQHELFNEANSKNSNYSYSNIGYAFLGLILEKSYQKSYKDILKDNLFTLLGINHFILGDDHESLTDETIKLRTWPHIKNESKLLAINPSLERSDNPNFYQSSTNLLLSHNDWIKFFKVYKDREFQSVQNIIKRDFMNPHFEDYSLGGWFVKMDPLHGELWTHSGANGGNSSFARFYKDRDIVLLINFNSYDNDLMDKYIDVMDREIRDNILGN